MPALTIEDRTATGTPIGSITFPDFPERMTLRDLIRLRVREEVARYNLNPSTYFQGLVQPVDARPLPRGFEMSKARRIDWELQADFALAAFARNGFFVLVDRKQVTDLDAQILLTPTLDVAFVKLTPLVGG